MLITTRKGFELNYEVYGQGKRLLLLHGWGTSLNSFDTIATTLSPLFQVVSLDLPGFGLSKKPIADFGVMDYKNVVEDFLETLEINEVYLLGHSFGGAVSILLSTNPVVKKLILEDSSGIRLKSFATKLKIVFYKLAKKVLPLSLSIYIRNMAGSVDYKNAGELRGSFIKIINEDLKPYLTKIAVPTLIIWGDKDHETSLTEARVLNKNIKGSKLTVMSNCDHFPHLRKPAEFVSIVANFLKDA